LKLVELVINLAKGLTRPPLPAGVPSSFEEVAVSAAMNSVGQLTKLSYMKILAEWPT
jgi:type IV secretory pathway VirB3-like protein